MSENSIFDEPLIFHTEDEDDSEECYMICIGGKKYKGTEEHLKMIHKAMLEALDTKPKKTKDMKSYSKEYYKNNKDKIKNRLTPEEKKEYLKKYYENNKENYSKRYQENKEECINKSKTRYQQKKKDKYIAEHGSLEGYEETKKIKYKNFQKSRFLI